MATRRERINVGEKAEKGYLTTTTAAAFLYVLDSSYKVVVAFDLNGRWQCAGELPSAQPPARSTREELDSKEVLKHARSQQAELRPCGCEEARKKRPEYCNNLPRHFDCVAGEEALLCSSGAAAAPTVSLRRQAYLIDKRPCQSSLQKLGNGLISLFKLKEAYTLAGQG